jgi:hypothetical protein
MEYAIVAFLIVFLLLSSGLLLLFYRDALSRRLSSVLVERGRPGLLERWKRTSAAETAGIGAELIRRTMPDESKARAVQHRLILAGYRQEFIGRSSRRRRWVCPYCSSRLPRWLLETARMPF